MFLVNILNPQQEDKFTSLYKKNFKLLYSIAKKHLSSKEDIEDCIQETFAYVVNNFHKIEHSSAKESRNYLATLVNGFAINKYKKESKYSAVSDIEVEHISQTTSTSFLLNNYSEKEISHVIDMLNETDKTYFYLTYIYGYSSKEIASMFNVKDSYVRKRLQLSKQFLRKELSA